MKKQEKAQEGKRKKLQITAIDFSAVAKKRIAILQKCAIL
jgi:hypothetical protein